MFIGFYFIWLVLFSLGYVFFIFYTQGVCFNGSASVLYLTATVIGAVSLNLANRGRYYFISWVASTVRETNFLTKLAIHFFSIELTSMSCTMCNCNKISFFTLPSSRYNFNNKLFSFQIFASLAMLCYAGNTVVILKSWRSKSEDM